MQGDAQSCCCPAEQRVAAGGRERHAGRWALTTPWLQLADEQRFVGLWRVQRPRAPDRQRRCVSGAGAASGQRGKVAWGINRHLPATRLQMARRSRNALRHPHLKRTMDSS